MLIQFFSWSGPENVSSSLSDLQIGDKVAVQHKWGVLIGTLVGMGESGENVVGDVLRKAEAQDFETILQNKKKEKKYLKDVKGEVRKSGLTMKVVDVTLTLDGGCLIVFFVADARVDFRELVKTISSKLGKSVRFQQVGARDEAKKMGGFGICGRELCCVKFSRGLQSITTNMARSQLIAHRGSERLSGLCGRLMCCLAYESKQYEDLLKGLPTRGEKVIYKGKEFKVVDVIVLEEEVKITDDKGTMIVVGVSELDERDT